MNSDNGQREHEHETEAPQGMAFDPSMLATAALLLEDIFTNDFDSFHAKIEGLPDNQRGAVISQFLTIRDFITEWEEGVTDEPGIMAIIDAFYAENENDEPATENQE